jgi:hypothetical protein
VRFSHARGAHFVKDDVSASLSGLPGGLGTCEAAPDDMNFRGWDHGGVLRAGAPQGKGERARYSRGDGFSAAVPATFRSARYPVTSARAGNGAFMKLRVFSVVGEALNFGARRIETTIRIGWLAVVLMLIVNMAAVFASISVAVGRVVSFADLRTFQLAESLMQRAFEMGVNDFLFRWANGDLLSWGLHTKLLTVMAVSFLLQAVLVSSFTAPLIRLAGLGEEPRAGFVRLPFGPDQIRYMLAGLVSFLVLAVFVLGPAGATAFFVLKYMIDALSTIYASFPDPDSLHTIELVSGADIVAAEGRTWVYDAAIPLAAAVPFALAFWWVLVRQFRPEDGSRGRPGRRALFAFVALALAVGVAWFGILERSGEPIDSAAGPVYAVVALLFVIAYYVNLRFTPYPGVAVCNRSMAFAGAFRVSRRWNLIRLLAVVILLSSMLLAVQLAMNLFIFGGVAIVWQHLLLAVHFSTKMVGNGADQEWVRPVFLWSWNGIKILYNIVWALFSYGVAAGLLGRLYRESARGASGEFGPPPWRRRKRRA